MWEEKGTNTALQQANHIWKRALEEYHQPKLEESKLEALESFVTKLIEDPGIPNYRNNSFDSHMLLFRTMTFPSCPNSF